MQREDILDYMESDIYKPLTVQEFSEVFDLTSADDFRDLVKLLNQLEDEGVIIRSQTNRYALPEAMNLVVGKLQMKARGYGFVISEQTGESDVYIPSHEMNGAMSGDKVMARVEGQGKGGPHREGVIVRVVERANEHIVGKITIYEHHAFVDPIDKRFQEDIFIPSAEIHEAHDGYIVVVELTSFPSETHGPVGKVVEVLGHPDEPGIDILSVIRKYALPETFPEKVLQAAEAIPIEIDPAEIAVRRDLREEVIVTIDGEDAKDLDDAVHVKELENGNMLLGVHIADVGYYVKQGGTLDKEAFRRGTSVYLVDRVIPMLPQRLSNNICSLNPRVDRLALSCEMEIDDQGVVVKHDIFPSIIKTTARMTYNNVRKILVDHDESLRAEYAPLVPMFERMEQLALILREKRMRRGAVDFDFEEVKIVVDELGTPLDIVPRQRSIAEKLIEEFMLAANETVAEHFHWLGVPFVYRVHEEPEADKMLDLNVFLHNFGYHLKGVGGRSVHPRALQAVLQEVEGKREARMISTVMLRSMQQAKYRPDCSGHFGLAAEYYTHFTSPIRRYPDLTIHRIMREVLTGGMSDEREASLREFVEEASRQSSERERLAQDAEREVDQLKMVEYMQSHIGGEFDGMISSVTQFGLFIQLENGVEGLIHISTLADDYYAFNDRQMALIGEHTRRVFRLGDPVRIEVLRTSKEDLQIDFALVAHYREGTYIGGSGSEAIVYDEDLSPKERRRRMEERKETASPASQRGNSASYRGGRGAGGRVEGGFSRDGVRRDAEPPVQDMPYDEWDEDFPDPREAREQDTAEREAEHGGRRDRNGRGSSGRGDWQERSRGDRGAGFSRGGRTGSGERGRRRAGQGAGAGDDRRGEERGGYRGGAGRREEGARGGRGSGRGEERGGYRGGAERREEGSSRGGRGYGRGEERGGYRGGTDRREEGSSRGGRGYGRGEERGGYRGGADRREEGARGGRGRDRYESRGESRGDLGNRDSGTRGERYGGDDRRGERGDRQGISRSEGFRAQGKRHKGGVKAGAKSAARKSGGRGGFGGGGAKRKRRGG
ncbi:ribonuclease R [Alicyclobacillus fodiniaquatilis]|uniref:Ribonuclease R n=1 Tax=Alicyclobacillus fodiniaquatilis TaxID=1661150 RepID=A0ABW4JK13_9BACL